MDDIESLPTPINPELIESLAGVEYLCKSGALNTVLGVDTSLNDIGNCSAEQLAKINLANHLELFAKESVLLVAEEGSDFMDNSDICIPDLIPADGIAYSGAPWKFQGLRIVSYVYEAEFKHNQKMIILAISDDDQTLLIRIYTDGISDKHRRVFISHHVDVPTLSQTTQNPTPVVGKYPDIDKLVALAENEEGLLGYIDLIKHENEFGYMAFKFTGDGRSEVTLTDRETFTRATANWTEERVAFIYNLFDSLVSAPSNASTSAEWQKLTNSLRDVYGFDLTFDDPFTKGIERLLDLRNHLIDFYNERLAIVLDAVQSERDLSKEEEMNVGMLNAFMAYMEEVFGDNFFNMELDWRNRRFRNELKAPMFISKLFPGDILYSVDDRFDPDLN